MISAWGEYTYVIFLCFSQMQFFFYESQKLKRDIVSRIHAVNASGTLYSVIYFVWVYCTCRAKIVGGVDERIGSNLPRQEKPPHPPRRPLLFHSCLE